jgi:hypothetical protein
MKRIFVILCVLLLSVGQIYAYTQEEFDVKKASYSLVIEKKIVPKLEGLSQKILKKVLVKIDVFMEKYE